ncbi:hypothetical protein ACTFIW_003847 [Dictyostelium discoideum]
MSSKLSSDSSNVDVELISYLAQSAIVLAVNAQASLSRVRRNNIAKEIYGSENYHSKSNAKKSVNSSGNNTTETVAIVNPVVGVMADLTTSMDHQVMLQQKKNVYPTSKRQWTYLTRTLKLDCCSPKEACSWFEREANRVLDAVIPFRLYTRRTEQTGFHSQCLTLANRDWNQSFPIPRKHVSQEISHWLTVLNQWNGKEIILFPSAATYVLTTDGSESGASGQATQSNMSSNRREMLALLMAYQALCGQIQDLSVLRPPQPSFRDESQIIVQSNQELQLATEEGSVQSRIQPGFRFNYKMDLFASHLNHQTSNCSIGSECTPPRPESMEAMSGLPTAHPFVAFYPGEDEHSSSSKVSLIRIPNLEISNLVSDDSSSSSSSSSSHVSPSSGSIPKCYYKSVESTPEKQIQQRCVGNPGFNFQSHVCCPLFEYRNVRTFSTINGHRSMLNQLLLLKNQTDIVNDPFITRIMTGIHIMPRGNFYFSFENFLFFECSRTF